ncbi:MAG: PEP-CTERM sorting domain-containing protein [Desulfuromusa sp.]
MKKMFLVLLMMFVALPAFASNITIWDGNGYSVSGQGGEDQETEPGMTNSQVWDLEGFFLEGNNLSMVGGFDFRNGVSGYSQYSSGDIFISTGDASPAFGNIDGTVGFNEVSNSYGYNYVFDLDFDSMKYAVLSLNSDSQVRTTYYAANEGSSPWQYVSAGSGFASGSFSFGVVTDTGFAGGTHYALTGFDLSFLGGEQDFYSHFTMGCGNDNLMGQGTTAPVPEPATLILLGSGLAGLAFYRRKQKK